MNILSRPAFLHGLDYLQRDERRSLAEKIAAHRAAVLSPENVERLKRFLAEAERAAKGGRA